MSGYKGAHLPQIEWFYEGFVYQFIGKANLKELVEMRKDHISTTDFKYYNQEARNEYYQYLECIEKCMKILISNHDPEFAINELNKKQKKEERIMNEFKDRIHQRLGKK